MPDFIIVTVVFTGVTALTATFWTGLFNWSHDLQNGKLED